MKYRSSRGGDKGFTFEQVLFAGYSSDGGLYVPQAIPLLSAEALECWSRMSYKDILKEVCGLFVSPKEVSREEIGNIVEEAYKEFTSPSEPLSCSVLSEGDGEKGPLLLGELYHGPTMTFKDLALSVTARFMDLFLSRRGRCVTVLIGTSGDTGSAAIRALRPLSSADVVVLLPRGRVTPIQERQMTTVVADNVHVYSVEGTSDDLDEPIKRVFANSSFASEHSLCSLNSINWARIMAQAAHFAFMYFEARRVHKGSKSVRIVVPTGACGNIAGGFLAAQILAPLIEAKEKGWPRLELAAAVGSNDCVHVTVSSGLLTPPSDTVHSTWASAIDISAPYNVERLLYFASGADADRTKAVMEALEEKKAGESANIPADVLSSLRSVVTGSGSYSNEEIEGAIRECHQRHEGKKICPHTAVAYRHQAVEPRGFDTVTVLVATASAAKFPEALEAAGVEKEDSEEVRELFNMKVRFGRMDRGQDWKKMLEEKIEEITEKRRKQ